MWKPDPCQSPGPQGWCLCPSWPGSVVRARAVSADWEPEEPPGGKDLALRRCASCWIAELLPLGLFSSSCKEVNCPPCSRAAREREHPGDKPGRAAEYSRRGGTSNKASLSFRGILYLHHSYAGLFHLRGRGKLLFPKTFLVFDKNFGRIQKASVTSKSQVIPYKPSITSPSSHLGLSAYIKYQPG